MERIKERRVRVKPKPATARAVFEERQAARGTVHHKDAVSSGDLHGALQAESLLSQTPADLHY